MRELKFRAWDKNDKEFAHKIYCLLDMSVAERVFVLDDEDGALIIEQYTGLKDKNGKEIYEGDIVEFRKRAYEVKFDKYGQFYIENKNYHWLENGYSFRNVDVWCAEGILVEVIGNIHENPELLDKEKE